MILRCPMEPQPHRSKVNPDFWIWHSYCWDSGLVPLGGLESPLNENPGWRISFEDGVWFWWREK